MKYAIPGEASAAAAHLPLRERNFARLRLRVLAAVLDLTAQRPLADVSVREICETVEISQGTFFNHFPSKDAVLVYYMRLWSIRAAARARAAAPRSGWEALRAVFASTADEIEAHPSVMFEIITLVAQAKAPPAPVPISRAERLLAFPDLPDVEAVEPVPVDALLAEGLAAAMRHGELPPTTDPALATRLLKALFYGVPLASRAEGIAAIRPAYEAGLRTLQVAFRREP